MTTIQIIEKIFNRLDDWRKLPAYQLERRADIFFSLYLEELIKSKFNQDVDLIIPEFPIRIGDISETKIKSNLSFKIDYVSICLKTKKVFLLELKTDDGSHRESQKEYLKKAKNLNTKGLVKGVLLLNKATKSKKKYINLIELLSNIGWIDNDLMIGTCEDYEIEIVFIQPNSKGSEIENHIISFDCIISLLKNKEDVFSKRFLKSLVEWKNNPN
jgi:hypothetical protein